MGKRSDKKLTATRNNMSKQHQTGKDHAVALKKNKTVCRKTAVKKVTTKKVTTISGNCGQVHSPILSRSKDKKGKRFRAMNKRTPGAIEIQKLLTAFSEDSTVFKTTESQAKNQIEQTSAALPVSETLEQTAPVIERQVRAHIEENNMMSPEQSVQLQEELQIQPESEQTTGVCDCCGKTDISESHLVRIDSGQRLCPACFGELRGAVGLVANIYDRLHNLLLEGKNEK